MANALIIDDEMDICFLLSNILRHEHLNPECVNLLSDADAALIRTQPAIVFLDNRLPDGMGVNFIDHIKHLTPSAKIIMITAYDNSSDRNKASLLGVDSFIGKPFTSEMIIKTVEQLIHT